MSKFSVKKPLTVFVAVIAVLVLGVIAYLNMTPDLLPNIDFPYVMIMTTYPGASPEKVESEVSKPLEQSMASIAHIKEITSTSSESYSMLMLEFEEGTNLDTAGLDIQQAITALQGTWDEMIGAPYVLKINPSLLPVMVAAVSNEGMDNIALTQYLDETLLSKLEGIAGVARVSTNGTIHQQLHIVLDQKKIDALNKKIADTINEQMDSALEDLTKSKEDLLSAQQQMAAGKAQLESGKTEMSQQMAAGETELSKQLWQLYDAKGKLETTLSLLKGLQSGRDALLKPIRETEAKLKELTKLILDSEELNKLTEEFEKKIAELKESDKTDEEIKAAIEKLKGSKEYKKLQADIAALETKLATLGTSIEGLDDHKKALEEALAALKQKLEDFEKTIAEQDIKNLDESVAEAEANLTTLTEGITALEDAQTELNKQKMEGLLQLANASTEISVNSATVTAALTQIDGGITTLENTREETLGKADLTKLLTMDMVKNILTAQNFYMPAGTVSQDGISYMVSVGEEITSQQDLSGLLLFDMNMEGMDPIYLEDVAAVMLTDNRNETYAKLDGKDGVMLTFEKQSTYATAEVTENIQARFDKLEEENPGLRFMPLMDQGDYIYLIVEQILSSLLWGAIFSVLILFLFLKDIKPTFITLCSIPISVIFAIVLMYFSGVTLNMISLSGLAVAVGMLVDNSVVVIENIYRLRAKGANVVQAAVSGARQVAGAVIASTLTTVCVFLPIVFVTGITKQLFTDLALTMTYALMASLIVALTLVPAMASGLLRKRKEQKSPWMDKFLALYRKAAAWSLDHKLIVLLCSVVLLIGSAIWSISKGFIFMAPMDMPSVSVSVSMPENSTMEQASELADEVLSRIGTLEGIETAGAMMDGENHNVTVYITLSNRKASGAEMGKKIEDLCADLECTVSATSAMMDISMLSGSGITVHVYANNMEELQAAAKETARLLETVPGVKSAYDGLDDTSPALHIRVDRNKAMAKGITVAQIYMELAAELQTSATAATLNLDGTSTSVIIEKPEETLLTPDNLLDYTFRVTTQTGEENVFTLGEVATIEETQTLNTISRLDQRRYLNVTAELNEGANVTLVTSRAQRVLENAQLGKGVTYAFDGENETIMEAVEQLALMLVLGILLVYLVMVAQFQSLKSPFIVMFTIPLALTGGFMALLICGLEISVISLIGFIMLTGIIVNNGIVLVDYINQLRLEGTERREAILEAGVTRMRPILMTTLTTVLGLLVMAFSKDAGSAMMRPIAVVCIGGLMYATLMTLFVVPCIYDMLNKKELKTVRDEDLELLDL